MRKLLMASAVVLCATMPAMARSPWYILSAQDVPIDCSIGRKPTDEFNGREADVIDGLYLVLTSSPGKANVSLSSIDVNIEALKLLRQKLDSVERACLPPLEAHNVLHYLDGEIEQQVDAVNNARKMGAK